MTTSSFEDIFATFKSNPSILRSQHSKADLAAIVSLIATPPEERVRQILEEIYDRGWNAHAAEVEAQSKNPEHPITNPNPWRKR